MARTGNEGGLYAVLKALAKLMSEEYANNEISARISHYWNQLTPQEWLAAGEEFIAKYGHLLPSEHTEGTGARIKADLPKTLKEYPRLLQQLRRVGR